jgi:carbonic anhydrase
MLLFEAIVEANHRALSGDQGAGIHVQEYAACLPVVALTCIDPRLNPLIPEVLGVPEEHFIWLRNAGNIITSTTSSTMRSLALACAIKGGKEIAILGHTDCKVGRMSAMELTDKFKSYGIERNRLPENLVEFFGMFASERQNIMRGAEYVRQSPLIGAKIPVHGLLVDIQSGKLEWIVNGYQTLATAASSVPISGPRIAMDQEQMGSVPAFKIGEMQLPEAPIGQMASTPPPTEPVHIKAEEEMRPRHTPASAPISQPKGSLLSRLKIDKSAMYKILGDDRKVYGPVTAAEIERWIEEGRIDLKSLAQKLGYKEWKQLESFVEKEVPSEIPIPPALNTALKVVKTLKDFKDRTRR